MALLAANAGTAYGTAKAGMGIASMAVTRPHLAFKSLVPVIMAGILSIYGLIISIVLSTQVEVSEEYNAHRGFKQFGAGITCGLCCLAAGYAIGVVGEVAVRMNGINEKIFIAIVLIMIFAEVIGLYGMIIGIIMALQ